MPSESHEPILHTEVHYIDSKAVGAEFKLLIGKSGLKPDTSPVALYLPDADLCFGGTMNALWGLQLAGWLPPILVVGIGYRVAEELETFTLRARDLTPSVDAEMVNKMGWMAGGANQFLEFIRDELKPWVADRFGVLPDDDVFFGDSLGGLFGAHVLLTEPGTFKRYGLGSASLWYDHGSTFELESAYAASHLDLAAKVFFSVGAYESPEGDQLHLAWLPEDKRVEAEAEAAEEEARYGVVDMVADQERFVAALRSRSYPNLVLESEILPGEFHMSVPQLNFSRSMRYLFGAPR
jgi:uncharacterized protein